MVIAKMKEYGTEEIHFCTDKKTGLNAIIAIHSTVLGPSTGGTRIFNYSNEEDALEDVLRLSKGMTHKIAVAGMNYGGAKGVIIAEPENVTEELLLAYGRFVEGLGGKFNTGEDVNMTEAYTKILAKTTKYVRGYNSVGQGGDPSPYTSRGVFKGMQAGANLRWCSGSLAGKTVSVQGLGKVGYGVCELLRKDGAKLIVSDINKEKAEKARNELGAEVVDTRDIVFVNADIFSPNAMGAVIKAEDVPKYKFELVCGGANNVLKDNAAGDALAARDILYLPDYVVNAGGVISVILETEGRHTHESANEHVDVIYKNVMSVINFAKAEGIPIHLAADIYAEKIIEEKRNAE
jgi:leucine dehydrogenase